MLGSSSGSIPEVLAGAGVIFPEANPAALAHAARLLLDQPQLAAALADKARTHALANYTWARVAAQRVALYRRWVA